MLFKKYGYQNRDLNSAKSLLNDTKGGKVTGKSSESRDSALQAGDDGRYSFGTVK
jgi:hypothetical protein